MQEKSIEIKGLNPAELFGVNNSKLKQIKSFFPKLKIVARGNILTILGEQDEVSTFEKKFQLVIDFFIKYNSLSENEVNALMSEGGELLVSNTANDTLVHGNGGIKIKARTQNQRKLVEAVNENDMVFAVGPAGTGKTYTAVDLAVIALKAK